MSSAQIIQGDCRDILAGLPEKSVHCCVTSPPYFGLRDYGVPPVNWPAMQYVPMAGMPPVDVAEWSGCLGLEPDPLMFIGHMVEVFRAVRRVLVDDGTCWVNLGDSYATRPNGGVGKTSLAHAKWRNAHANRSRGTALVNGIKHKDLLGTPWLVAFALQADGWYLRQDIIWNKTNPMPESVKDRCTKAHEYIFLLSKSEKYFYDFKAVKEKCSGTAHARRSTKKAPAGWDTSSGDGGHGNFHKNGRDKKVPGVCPKSAAPGSGVKANKSFSAAIVDLVDTRNLRSVWTVSTQPYSGAHFATFPEKLIEPCILAGCPEGGTVLDPFGGSGTTGRVALRHRRKAILIELNQEYLPLQRERTSNIQIRMFR